MGSLIKKRNQYEHAFRLLVSDFLRVCEFLEPVDAHLAVYSHRLYELLLRGCTEFESLCREVLTAQKYPKDGYLNIADYLNIQSKIELQSETATVMFWRPDPINLSPFSNWTPETPSLKWFKGYNTVKHNRNLEFSNASFENVRDCLTGLFIVLAKAGIIENDQRHRNKPGSQWQGTYTFDGLPFGLLYGVHKGRAYRERSLSQP